MRRVVAGFTFLAISVAAVASGTAVADTKASSGRSTDVTNGPPQQLPPHVPGEVLVRYKKGVAGSERASVRSAAGATMKSDIAEFRTQVLDLPAQASVKATVARLNADPRVAYAEPNYLIQVDGGIAMNDPQLPNLWGFNNTGQSHGISPEGGAQTAGTGTPDADADVVQAWGSQQGSPGTVIAVIDSGVDVTHPDLAPNLWTNPGESGGGKETDGLDNDGNGYADDVYGWDTAGNDNTLLDSATAAGYDHGTHVAGTIAAAGNNSQGVVGVCPGCRIMVLKFMKPFSTPDGPVMSGSTSDELEAIAYAKKKKADIINGSYGSFGFSNSQRSALASLAKKNILGVFAAGNSAADNDLAILDGSGNPMSPSYPAAYTVPGIMSVAASQDDDRLGYWTACHEEFGLQRWQCAFSSYGEQSIDVAAPGVDTLSTVPGNSYAYFNGTSMASPFVAGIAGLVESKTPSLTPLQIKNKIMRGVDKPANLGTLDTFVVGGEFPGKWIRTAGRVDAVKALNAGTKNFGKTDGNVDGAKKVRGVMSGKVKWGGDANDVFKKKLAKGNKYKVILNGGSGDTYGCCSLDLVVYAPGVKEIYDWNKAIAGGFTPDSNDETATFKATKDGMHFFQVNSFLADPFSYTLKVKKV